MQKRGKILVIRGGAIGDFILTLPVLSALRTTFPDSDLAVLGYSKVAQLALGGGLVDDVRSIDAPSLAGFFAQNGTLSPELGKYFSTFNIIISYLYDPDEVFQQNIRRCSSAQFIQGPHRPNENAALHATDVFLKPLERLAIFDADPNPCLPISSDRVSHQRIAFHPGSGSEKKNWPEANWSELLKRLSCETSYSFLMIGGEAEEKKLERLKTSVPIDRLQLAIDLPLVDLAQQLARCSFFVGHDSGITHLAAAVGLKSVVLWGPSNEQIWRPRSQHIRLLRASDLSLLSVSEVFTAVSSQIR